MRANPDFNATHPYQTRPASGWGNPNTTGEWVVYDARSNDQVGDPHPDAAEAAIAAARLANAT